MFGGYENVEFLYINSYNYNQNNQQKQQHHHQNNNTTRTTTIVLSPEQYINNNNNNSKQKNSNNPNGKSPWYLFAGYSSALTLYDLARKMSKDNNELLWMAVVGVTEQYVNSKGGSTA